ncbi:serine/threonine-protein kinase 17B isoform X2 [Ornithorhynchus anatinus]|uniref:serine/threonine-protein kinase 17B isoform X2 n=1 Tax=Ornithorhynchus anatinus TaxID=9258 RepID=UPI0010A7654B|nr:serine/threonine-protein kinase 17B isoform X2 [Ornithorhynchus anatinus]
MWSGGPAARFIHSLARWDVVTEGLACAEPCTKHPGEDSGTVDAAHKEPTVWRGRSAGVWVRVRGEPSGRTVLCTEWKIRRRIPERHHVPEESRQQEPLAAHGRPDAHQGGQLPQLLHADVQRAGPGQIRGGPPVRLQVHVPGVRRQIPQEAQARPGLPGRDRPRDRRAGPDQGQPPRRHPPRSLRDGPRDHPGAGVPQNILLSALQPLGDVKLVDFGLSRKLSGPCELREILGTPEYLAPEVLNYDPITTATDMWNIGIIAYMLLAHSSPFAGEDNQETYLNISQVNVDYSEPAFSSVSHLARDFIRTLLVKNPEERPTASSCLSHPWLQQRASAPSPHPADASSSSPSSSSSTPQAQDLPAKCPEDRPVKPPSASPCGPREDKENIPEGRSTKVPKRFRFDAALRPPPELVPDLVF